MSHHQVNQLVHIMWSTNNQEYAIPPSLKNDLQAYISSIVNAKNGKVFAIKASSDHIHTLILLPPEISLSMLLNHVKACSSKWIKSHQSVDPNFTWQIGYLAIGTQANRLDNVCNYIRADEERHITTSKTYLEELSELLDQQNIEYNKKYFQQNSFSKVCIHAVWSTKNRVPYLIKNIRLNLFTSLGEIILNNRGKVHIINGIEDHIHILMETPKDKALSDLINELKTKTSHWLKKQCRTQFQDFEWQTGYGAFSVSPPSIETVTNYISRQEEHHREKTSKEEWDEFLETCGC